MKTALSRCIPRRASLQVPPAVIPALLMVWCNWCSPLACSGSPPEPIFAELRTSLDPQMDLEAGWRNPPRTARTRCWWWWLNGNVTKEAITRDLEEMRAKGLGGANVIDAGGANQRGNRQVSHGPDFGSPAWRKLFVHALSEAERLNLELGFNIQSGWNLGGPTVQWKHAPKKLTWSEMTVDGGDTVRFALPQPPASHDYYRDVAVLAIPLPKAIPTGQPIIVQTTAGSSQSNFPAEKAIDNDPATFWVSGSDRPGEGPQTDRPVSWEVEFAEPVRLSRLDLFGRSGYGPKSGFLEIAEADEPYQCVAEFHVDANGKTSIRFGRLFAKKIKLVFTASYDRQYPDRPRNVQLAEVTLYDRDKRLYPQECSFARLSHFQQRTYDKYPGAKDAGDASFLLQDDRPVPPEQAVPASAVVDLTARVDSQGRSEWDAPPGRWKLLRIGYTVTGAHVSTSSEGWQGPAIDYLDASAFHQYWQDVMEPILADAKPYLGRSLRYFHTDSWELGPVNWTAQMPDQFKRLRGYDLKPYLPVMAGYVIEDSATSIRFLNDFRRTIGDLIAESKYGTFSEYAHRVGAGIHPESGGPHAAPVDALLCLGRSDIPMGEFWAPAQTHRVKDTQRLFVKQAASAAHIYGKRVVLAEAFTSIGPQWERDPRMLKPVFDRVVCEGLNLTMCHTFDCSPPKVGVPGQAYFAGTHINPNVTWWDSAGAFFEYLNRCQFLLQQGLPVSNVLYFYGENVPSFVRLQRDDPAGVLPGYDYDVINAEALLERTRVETGQIVLPDGTSYRVLVLPGSNSYSLKTLKYIATLVKAGATVIGKKPTAPFGLSSNPPDEKQFGELADQLWQPGDSQTHSVRSRSERIFDAKASELLQEMDILPDFTYETESDLAQLDYIHRRTADADIYFVANRLAHWTESDCKFRVTSHMPEIWDPVSGAIRDASAFSQDNGHTTVPLKFPPHGSTFVIFRRAIPKDAHGHAETNWPRLTEKLTIPGPWTVAFDPRWGGPGQAEFVKLVDWTERGEEGIKYYSGTAVYKTTFVWQPNGDQPSIVDTMLQQAGEVIQDQPGCVLLDLGKLNNIASVRLNHKRLGIVWTEPLQVDVTEALQRGSNELEISVTNLWPNRLIGDQRLAPEKRLTRTNIQKFRADSPLLPSGLIGPVRLLQETTD